MLSASSPKQLNNSTSTLFTMAAAAATPPPQQQQQQPSFGQSRWVPSLPTSLIASLNPFAAAEEPKDAGDTQQNDAEKRPTLSMMQQASGPPSPTKSTGSIMFAEPESQGTSVSGSREGSLDGKRRSKKNNKPKTSYSICHPPPASSTRQKLHRRPRSLIQLHKLTANARPLPAFEVIPSANFSVRLTRAIAKVFKAKHSLCPSDLVVLRAEDYYSEEPEEDQEARDVVALICKGRKEDGAAAGKAKICMADGQEWEAYQLMNGGYEFFTTDEHGLGLTTRWVPKKDKKEGAKADSKRFKFSTISANTRRHPVIANLSKSSLAIFDTYKMPDISSPTPQATPRQQATVLEDGMDSDDNNKQEVRITDDRLRSIITMTSIWVAFKEGWSPYFKYDDHATAQASNSRRNSVTTPVNSPPESPINAPQDKRASILSVGSSLFRKGSLRNRTGTFSSLDNLPATETASPARSPVRSPSHKATGRSRADSNSTVLVHRAASNRRNNRAQATWRPDLLSAGRQSEVRETSREGTPVEPEQQQQQESTSRSPSSAAPASDLPMRRASILPDPEPERRCGEPAGSRGQSVSASSNATSDAGGVAKKQGIVVNQTERKGKKWKRWICGKF